MFMFYAIYHYDIMWSRDKFNEYYWIIIVVFCTQFYFYTSARYYVYVVRRIYLYHVNVHLIS